MPQAPESRDFFRSHVEEYDRTHYGDASRTFMSVRLERLLECVDRLGLAPGSRVFEGGCGPGHLVEALVRRDFDVAALDTSPGMLDLTGKRIARIDGEAHLRLALGSIDRLPWADETFALATTCGVIEYLEDDDATLAEMARVLEPGGYLLLPVTNALSPMFAFEGMIEFVKRQKKLLTAINRLWTRNGRAPIRPRHFTVRRHRPGQLRDALARAGFDVVDQVHYHFVPCPRPIDALAPRLTERLGDRMESLGRGPLGFLADGYLVVARKPPTSRSAR